MPIPSRSVRGVGGRQGATRCGTHDEGDGMLRIVIAKPGLDGHNRGVKVVARALRDAGHEVIYTGLHQSPDQIVETAIQEDADLVGLSVLSGAHMTLFKALCARLEARDAADIGVFGAGSCRRRTSRRSSNLVWPRSSHQGRRPTRSRAGWPAGPAEEIQSRSSPTMFSARRGLS